MEPNKPDLKLAEEVLEKIRPLPNPFELCRETRWYLSCVGFKQWKKERDAWIKEWEKILKEWKKNES